jgi:hypothetical protein
MFRIRMNLENPNNHFIKNISTAISHKPIATSAPKNISLTAPMIDRVHRAKPGCSACGKKVA